MITQQPDHALQQSASARALPSRCLRTATRCHPRASRSRSLVLALLFAICALNCPSAERLRVIVETDAGGDPDDEQSLVRFLLYANEWDIDGIIANRPMARPGENKNSERTGLAIVRRLVQAYGDCYPHLVQHDAHYPKPELLLARTVAGYDDVDDGVKLIISAVDSLDPRPVWFMNWGTDNGSAKSCLKRALDQVLRERGRDGYAKFKQRLRLSSDDQFGDHTWDIAPPFPIWVDTFRPEMDRKRWYHRFSAITAKAGGFDLARDVLLNHGPLGALYPTNTTHWQKEGDTMTFLYLVPTGMNDPSQPTWGSWAGRYGSRTNDAKNYFWANQFDAWHGTTNRDNTLARWAVHLQNDFRARLDWCVKDFAHANHSPTVRLSGATTRQARPGDEVVLVGEATDSDNDKLAFEWTHYPEPGTYRGELRLRPRDLRCTFIAPQVTTNESIHIILTVTDSGEPPLTRYARTIVNISPKGAIR